MSSSISILIVSGEHTHQDWLATGVSSLGLRPVCCSTVQSAAELLGRHSFHVLLCEDELPDGGFDNVISHAARVGRPVPAIVTSRRDNWNAFLAFLNHGAFDYISLPPMPGEVGRIVAAAVAASGAPPRATLEPTGLQASQKTNKQSAA